MPENLDKCVAALVGKGYPEKSSYAICQTTIQKNEGCEDEKTIEMALGEAEKTKEKYEAGL